MKRKDIVLISSGAPNWVSCKTIVSNLTKSYQKVFPRAKYIYFNRKMLEEDANFSGTNCWNIANSIFELNPEKIIFTDHMPHPYLLIHAIRMKYGKRKLPAIVFHIYGDLTFQAITWLICATFLKGEDVKMICASEKQQKLVQGFLMHKEACTVCPFPVDQSSFYPDSKLGMQWRKKHKLEGILTITYSGRISMQKNVLELINEFLEFKKSYKGKVKLLIAGAPDDIDVPMFGIPGLHGDYLHQYNTLLNSLAEEDKNDILPLGFLSQKDLRGLYNASDIILSLSTHHDEDYGMAIAEAMACGCKAVITDWGGYGYFGHQFKKECKLVPVRPGTNGLTYDNKILQRYLHELAATIPGDRILTSRKCFSDFGILAVSKKLQKIHSKPKMPFNGFNQRLSLLASLLLDPSTKLYPIKDSHYEMIWKPYYENI